MRLQKNFEFSDPLKLPVILFISFKNKYILSNLHQRLIQRIMKEARKLTLSPVTSPVRPCVHVCRSSANFSKNVHARTQSRRMLFGTHEGVTCVPMEELNGSCRPFRIAAQCI